MAEAAVLCGDVERGPRLAKVGDTEDVMAGLPADKRHYFQTTDDRRRLD
jgi:hypothetical protein